MYPQWPGNWWQPYVFGILDADDVYGKKCCLDFVEKTLVYGLIYIFNINISENHGDHKK